MVSRRAGIALPRLHQCTRYRPAAIVHICQRQCHGERHDTHKIGANIDRPTDIAKERRRLADERNDIRERRLGREPRVRCRVVATTREPSESEDSKYLAMVRNLAQLEVRHGVHSVGGSGAWTIGRDV